MEISKAFNQLYSPLRKYIEMENIFDISLNRPSEIILEKLDGSIEYVEDEALNIDFWKKFANVLANKNKATLRH